MATDRNEEREVGETQPHIVDSTEHGTDHDTPAAEEQTARGSGPDDAPSPASSSSEDSWYTASTSVDSWHTAPEDNSGESSREDDPDSDDWTSAYEAASTLVGSGRASNMGESDRPSMGPASEGGSSSEGDGRDSSSDNGAAPSPSQSRRA